jgi:HEAT repeat protein
LLRDRSTEGRVPENDFDQVGKRKPNIRSLARRKDVEGLVNATSYREVRPTSSAATATDLGIPVRAEAIRALGALGSATGSQAIEAGLRDPADQVRCAAVRVLHDRRQGAVLGQALGWLPTEQGYSRKLAVQAVLDLRRSVGAATVVGALVHREDDELLGEHDTQLSMTILDEGGAEAAEATIQVVVQALSSPRGIVVDRAAELLVRLAPASTQALVAELRTGSAPADAAYVLGRIADPGTRHALVEALWHDDGTVRAESAAALAELEDPETVKPLLRAMRDPEHRVRVQAARALDRLGTAAVIVGVAALLERMFDEAIMSARPQARLGVPNGGPPEARHPPPLETPRGR